MYIYTYTYVYIHIHVCVWVCVRVRVCVHVRIHTYLYTYLTLSLGAFTVIKHFSVLYVCPCSKLRCFEDVSTWASGTTFCDVTSRTSRTNTSEFSRLAMFVSAIPTCTWLVHISDMTHAHVWHASFICLPSPPIHDPFTCVTWLVHMCDITHAHVWRDAFSYVCTS